MEFSKINAKTDQRGFAAVIIAIVLVLVLSLVTIGFASLMRREQRSALDKQLSSQAYYAAETGINDAVQAIQKGGFTTINKPCGPYPVGTTVPAGASYLTHNTIGSGTTAASYPCLLINPAPSSLEYNPISTTVSKVIELTTGSPISSLHISWEDPDHLKNKPTDFAGSCSSFGPAGGSPNWSYIGMLRLQLILPDLGLSRDVLTSNSYTAFLCPGSGPGGYGTGNYANHLPATNGEIINGNCNSVANPSAGKERYCNVKIDGLSGTHYFLDLKSIYNPTNVSITAVDSGGVALNFKNAQLLIDSTGKAQDVLRRIQVRVPAKDGYEIPDGTHGNSGICKQLKLMPSFAGSSSYDCTPT